MIEASPKAGLFIGLGAAATYYMWGLAYENGTFDYAAAACHPVTHTTRRDYTYLPPRETGVDNILCTLISVFDAVFAVPRAHALMQSFSAVVAAPVAITYLESYRASSPAFVRYSPMIFGILCQTIGSALAYPLYYAIYCLLVEAPLATRLNDKGDGAKTVFPSILLGYFVTAAFMGDPLKTLTHLSADAKAGISAVWQVFPLWLTLLQLLSSRVMSKSPATGSFVVQRDKALNALMIVTTILHFAAASTFYKSIPSHSTAVEVLKEMVTVPGGIHPVGFPESAYLFILFDALFLVIATFLFILLAPGRTYNIIKLTLGMLGLSLTVGPGTAFLWGWKVREGK